MNGQILGAVLAMASVLLVVALIWWIVTIIAWWRLFTKAGEAGWKSIIPVYSSYVFYKIVWQVKWFWISVGLSVLTSLINTLTQNGGNTFLSILSMVIGIASLVIYILFCSKTAKAYGKGTGFAVGLFFLNPIFLLILAFGSSEYVGAQE